MEVNDIVKATSTSTANINVSCPVRLDDEGNNEVFFYVTRIYIHVHWGNVRRREMCPVDV